MYGMVRMTLNQGWAAGVLVTICFVVSQPVSHVCVVAYDSLLMPGRRGVGDGG